MKDTVTFNEFYTEKSQPWWSHHADLSQEAALRLYHPDFFYDTQDKENLVNYPILKVALDKEMKSSINAKARAFFKDLFRISWAPIPTKNLMATPSFLRLINNHGTKIMAHGVEEAKGGLLNIVMMCISDKVKVPEKHWGSLVRGAANISPVPHGPYFIIYDTSLGSEKPIPHYPSCKSTAYILVPCDEVAIILKTKLAEVAAVGLISQEALKQFSEKIVTYDALNEICSTEKPSVKRTSSKRTLSFFENTTVMMQPPQKKIKVTNKIVTSEIMTSEIMTSVALGMSS